MLKNRELDLVVLSQSDVTSEMEAVPLGMEDFLLILPGDHPLNERRSPSKVQSSTSLTRTF